MLIIFVLTFVINPSGCQYCPQIVDSRAESHLNISDLSNRDSSQDITSNSHITQPNAAAGNKKVIFLHHSCGSNLISGGNVRAMMTGNNTDFWDHGYNSGGVHDASGTYQGTYNIPGDNTYADGFDAIFHQDHLDTGTAFSNLLHHTDGIDTGVEFDVLAFKACYPENDNPTPAAAFTKFQHYVNVRDVCDSLPDRIFVFVTAPPLNNAADSSYKDKNNYTRHYCWDYMTNGTFLAGHPNCFVWDWNNLLNDQDPMSDDYCGLREEYQSGTDSHPNALANVRHGPLFVQFILDAIQNYTLYKTPKAAQVSFTSILELGTNQHVSVTFEPNQPIASCVIVINGQNYTMTNQSNWVFAYTWKPTTVGSLQCKIIFNNTNGLESSTWANFSVIAAAPPQIVTLNYLDSVILGTNQSFSVLLSDITAIDSCTIEIQSKNYSMLAINTANFTYSWQPTELGPFTVRLHFNDTLGNANSTTVTFMVRQTNGLGIDGFSLGYFAFIIPIIGIILRKSTQKRISHL